MTEQSKWINQLLADIQAAPTAEGIRLLENCGGGCARRCGHLEGILQLRRTAKDCKTVKDSIRFLKEHLGANIEETPDGFIMSLGKSACTCPMAPEVASPALCNCTCGHEKALWSAFFGKNVDVQIVESLLRGGKDCVIRGRV